MLYIRTPCWYSIAPKFKYTKNEIIEAGFKTVRKYGWSAFTTRSLADQPGSSSRPIFSFFSSMEQLEEEVVKRAVNMLHEYMTRQRTGDPWIDNGIGHVIFAYEEKNLFKGINDDKHIKHFKKYGDLIWDTINDSLADYPPFQGLSPEQIKKIQVARWLYAHGLSFQVSIRLWESGTRQKLSR